jgi:hypothetical protein
MDLEWRLEWFLSIGVEIQRKASIVPDDGAKISKILVKKHGKFFPEFFQSWYSKHIKREQI